MSLMGESGCNQVLSVDGCDQKQRLGRQSWTFRQSGVLFALRMQHPLDGEGVVIPPEGTRPAGMISGITA